MNYKLAKELKDAGFPQKLCVHRYETVCTCKLPDPYFPTLSELIDACGDKFRSLKTEDTKWWYADAGEANAGWMGIREFSEGGATREIAVARLWLALHAPKG